ncbi:MAG: hypothetical protein FJ271_27245 [Planctomycetes bacterium]|nr:hypothetical protein [Planctomycetota bacterium]
MNYGLLSALTLLALAPAVAAQENGDRFAGFPPINKTRPGNKSFAVLTSDVLPGLIRPKWTRAMTDLGAWPAMTRFKSDIVLVYIHWDGHRYKKLEATGEGRGLRSSDEGKSWKAFKVPPCRITPELVAVGDTLFLFDPHADGPTVRTTRNLLDWTEAKQVYEPGFNLWGIVYDAGTKKFWCAPHAIPRKPTDPPRQIRLITSTDGVKWQTVSTILKAANMSESTLRVLADGTMRVMIRRKYGRDHDVATAGPPYTEWKIDTRPEIVEGEHLFEVGGQVFLASRANLAGKPQAKEVPDLFDKRKSYSMVYRVDAECRLTPWAVMDSMGDCSYPFLVETPTEVLCAYYSQHQDRVCKVYLCGYDKTEFLKGRR